MVSEIIFAAGCFWGVQATFDKIYGILKTEAGYIGGKIKNPTYEDVCGGLTGYAEAVCIKYDSKVISLGELLDVFFMIHDPTTKDRQGPDYGTQYRSGIYYCHISDKKIILDKIKQYSSYFDNPILTEVKKATVFWPAESYHQKYFEKHQESVCRLTEANKERFLQKKLMPEQYWVMRGQGTEPPFSGKYIYTDEVGVYHCAACGQKLFHSDSKFQSDCGWPAFNQAIDGSIKIYKDFTHFMIRDEVVCSRCGSHLGHVFDDEKTKTGLRYCINSIALNFEEK